MACANAPGKLAYASLPESRRLTACILPIRAYRLRPGSQPGLSAYRRWGAGSRSRPLATLGDDSGSGWAAQEVSVSEPHHEHGPMADRSAAIEDLTRAQHTDPGQVPKPG